MGGDGLLRQGTGQQIRLEDDLFLGLHELADAAQQLHALTDGCVHLRLVVGIQRDECDDVLHKGLPVGKSEL